jgi:hypothetical protein
VIKIVALLIIIAAAPAAVESYSILTWDNLRDSALSLSSKNGLILWHLDPKEAREILERAGMLTPFLYKKDKFPRAMIVTNIEYYKTCIIDNNGDLPVLADKILINTPNYNDFSDGELLIMLRSCELHCNNLAYKASEKK